MKKNSIVLIEPEIPYNTGNIARTCVITDTALHLVRPFGFQLTDHYIRRSGMDYWEKTDLTIWDSLDEFIAHMEEEAENGAHICYIETGAIRRIDQIEAGNPVMLLFGKESKGLPKSLLDAHPERCYRIPMAPDQRSLNLSNSAAIALFEVLRQQGYPGLI
ncbi:MAG: tRNA (cytidine(34)-2'-O)-methyltransferase [Peptoniphilaceae bacterium]|nr:tRNA (cytidine(34)-2'-O)-methyltransferase [Peptoniphilaceae bacterium]MDY5766006.1 tRNA (cytidine(34)-2'-O)-methyltransferase [Peptoniphilaceae bacterium]MDY6147082.1 tRNA (cytidine(34)-2'-O)-methyltransferase [Peptoniphilaceae bacterium]